MLWNFDFRKLAVVHRTYLTKRYWRASSWLAMSPGQSSRMPTVCSACSSPLFSMPSVNSSSILRTADQLKEVISLTVALLPPLPDSATMVLEDLPVTANTLGSPPPHPTRLHLALIAGAWPGKMHYPLLKLYQTGTLLLQWRSSACRKLA